MFAALKETRVKREKTASPASRETWASRATGESWERQDQEGKMVPRGQRVVLVFQEILVLLAPPVRRVNSECLDCPDTQEDKDQRDLRDSKASLVPTERRELGGPQESQAHADREDPRGLEESEGREGRQEKPDQRATQETTARQDLPVRGVCQDLRDPQVSQDQRGLLGPQERMDSPDILDREEKLDSKARPDPLVLRAWLDLRDQPARLDQWETAVIPDPLARPASRVCPVLQAKKVLRVTRVPPDLPEKMVLPAREVSPENEVCPAPWGLTV